VPVVILGLTAVPTFAAPPLPDKPRWEYAELQIRTPRPVPPAFRGEGEEAEPASPTIRWTTGQAEVEVKDWIELADKLKATAPKKGLSATAQKIYMLNQLGSEGWELIGQQGGSPLLATTAPARGGPGGATRAAPMMTETWTFKRRVLP
jgi:hypothetical protein